LSDFNSKSILIIGATGGIGSYISEKFSELGAELICFSRNEEKLNLLKDKIGGEHLFVKGDAKNLSDIQNAVKLGIEKFGKIDVLIHAVGSIVLKPLNSIDEKTFRETIELNLISPFLSAKAVLPEMLKQNSGSCIFISSIAGSKGLINHEAISAAKGGLEAFVRSSAVTYAKKGIRFNAVALGLVETPLAEFLTRNELSLKASISIHPMGRIGKPEDIFGGIEYLASDKSSWVIGTVIPIDGGMKGN
jgi:NAD(P)-dependent dehydrogenase (short-subunit alcohol dehydrogenase family)